jgi:hypothetical protein
MVVRLPIFNDRIRRSRAGRLLVVAIFAAAWEGFQLKETDGYRWDYAALDFGTTMLGASLVEIVW